MADLGLDAAQRDVVARVLAEERRHRRHVVVAVSGAHAYGFPSRDSDVDLKAVHVEPTARVLGLFPPRTYAARMETLDGVEIDYSSNEIQSVLVGIGQGNGNFVERVLGSSTWETSPEHAALRPVVQRALSRKLYRHYLGFATSQLRIFEGAARPSVKKLLYVLRTALTGAHALRTGQIVTDLPELLAAYGLDEATELVALKRAGEQAVLSVEAVARWRGEVQRALGLLEAAYRDSPLPPETPNADEAEAWLIALRRTLL